MLKIHDEVKGAFTQVKEQLDSQSEGLASVKGEFRAMGDQMLRMASQVTNAECTPSESVDAIRQLSGQIASMHSQLTEQLHGVQEQAQLSTQLILSQTANNTRMLTALVEGELEVPRIFWMRPAQQTRLTKLMSPKSWLNNILLLSVVCECGMHVVPCGPGGNGFEIRQQKDFVKKYGPVLKISLMIIKIALGAGRALGLPHLPYQTAYLVFLMPKWARLRLSWTQ